MKNNFILGTIVGVILSIGINIVIANTIISSNAVSYINNKTNETTVEGSLDELFSAVDINNRLGDNDISTIADGTVTGALKDIDKKMNDSLLIWEGTITAWDTTNYITIDLTDEQVNKLKNNNYGKIFFSFGSGSRTLGASSGGNNNYYGIYINEFYAASINNYGWNKAIPGPDSILLYYKHDLENNKMYFWSASPISVPLRQIAVWY